MKSRSAVPSISQLGSNKRVLGFNSSCIIIVPSSMEKQRAVGLNMQKLRAFPGLLLFRPVGVSSVVAFMICA